MVNLLRSSFPSSCFSRHLLISGFEITPSLTIPPHTRKRNFLSPSLKIHWLIYLLGQDNEDIESSQKSPPAKRQRREGKSSREPKSVTPINRKRRYSTANWSAEGKMFRAEQAIKKLKREWNLPRRP